MNEASLLDRAFAFIIKRMVETGQAPHYTEVAGVLHIPVEEGRQAIHDLFAGGVPGWVFPNTDYISSFPPFSNLPTQYRISVDGQQKWFGQWGFESLAVSWLFPGKTVRIDAPCLDCGESIQVEMRDGAVLKAEPEGLMGYVAVPVSKWFEKLPYTWSTMNLFRSEEHIKNWPGFDAATEEGIVPLAQLVEMFSADLFQRRLDPDYFSHSKEYLGGLLAALTELGKERPFWSPQ